MSESSLRDDYGEIKQNYYARMQLLPQKLKHLSMHNSIMRNGLEHYFRGDLSLEDALIAILEAQDKALKAAQQTLIDYAQKYRV